MSEHNKKYIEELLRTFLSKDKSLGLGELRDELKKDENRDAKKVLLQLKDLDLTPDNEAIFKKLNEQIAKKQKKAYLIRLLKYAAIFLLPICSIGFYLWSNDKEVYEKTAYNSSWEPTEKHNAYIVLDEDTKIDISNKKNDTIQAGNGQALVVNSEGALIYNKNSKGAKEVIYHTFVVPRGAKPSNIQLSDGTRVCVNSGSKLRFPVGFASGTRSVFLEGEAYFNVKKSKDIPFNIKVNEFTVEVLGTEFNVNAYPENEYVLTTLVQGSVSVNATQNDKGVTLLPNQQAIYLLGDIKVVNVNPKDYISWIDGRFYFEKMPLQEIMQQLERWYDIEVLWDNNDLKTHKFTGALWQDSEPGEIVEMLEKTTGIRFIVSGRTINVTR